MSNQNAILDDNRNPTMTGESTTTPGEVVRLKVNPLTGALITESEGGGITEAEVTAAIDASEVPAKLDDIKTAVESQSSTSTKVDQRFHAINEGSSISPFTINHLTMKNVTIVCENTDAGTGQVFIKLKDDTGMPSDYVLKEGGSLPINANYDVTCYVNDSVTARAFVFYNL